jgi:hypothetical protein
VKFSLAAASTDDETAPTPPHPLGARSANASGAASPLFVPSRPEAPMLLAQLAPAAAPAACAPVPRAAATAALPALAHAPALPGAPMFARAQGAASGAAAAAKSAAAPLPGLEPPPMPARGLLRFGPGARMRLGPGSGQR